MNFYDPATKIWSNNVRSSIYNPKTSLGEVLLHSLKRTPDKICEISDDYETFSTCHELQRRSIQVAESLKSDHDVKFGDICAVVSRNNPEVSSVVFGCIFNGCPVNTLDPTFAQIDFDHMLGLTRPKIIFGEKSVMLKIKRSIEKLKLRTKVFCFTSLDGTVEEGVTSVKDLFNRNVENLMENYLPTRIEDTSNHIALIMCSSGTTGLSKGVCLSHAQIVSQTIDFCSTNQNSICFTFSSLYWITGYFFLLSGIISGSIRIITTKAPSAEYFFELIEKHRITECFLPPSMIAECLESQAIELTDFSSLQKIYTGGSMVLEDLREDLEKVSKAKVIVSYGMTEIGSACTTNFEQKAGSVGVPAKGNQIKIISEEGKSLGPLENGEICIKQPFMFLGYYGNEKAYREIKDSDGWLHTGDLGYFDENGYLFIVGRKKEMIKYKGYQISPGVIETIIQETTGLTQVCVVAVEENKQGTDLPAAVIVLPKNFLLTQDDIKAILDANLDDIKKLRGGIYFVKNLPMTPSGKVQRREVKELANKLYQSKIHNLINYSS
ncbi:probable 4-coumarate--CoA ligase 1 [Culicoides brevitarsis]|uniref:probable 4-coumarate--CoA ligase 1 n=1 Tax=Culicoides brevitarsis TaxID=469753 RepID=UPI00307C7F47